MDQEAAANKKHRPSVGWLSAHLSRKVLLGLVGIAVFSWVLLCFCFLLYLGDYASSSYDEVLASADAAAQKAAAFLDGAGDDFQALGGYLAEEGLFCTVRDAEGTLLYENLPAEETEIGPMASSAAELISQSGDPLRLRIWLPGIERKALSNGLVQNAFVGLFVLNAAVFLVAAVVLYLLVLSPIIRLRKMMKQYYEKGETPERSGRQDEIGRLQNTFADLTGMLAYKEKAEHRLIASISHDIKTPLTSVMGYTERLRAADLPPEKERQYLESVYEKALRIKAIVDEFDDYLDVGLRETAPMRLMTARELCEKLRAEYEAELLDAGVRFTIECGSPQAQFICNWEQMRRFFGNLISNSIQHAQADPLALHLDCRQQEGQLHLRFRDNGQGVPQALLQQIFEPLYTSDQGRKVSGLGLSICKSIVKAHGGTVGAEPAPNGGLLIHAALPCVPGFK